jgi:hypothetical protein
LRIRLCFGCKTIQNHASPFNYEGIGAGSMMSGPLINCSSETAAPFQFQFIVFLHGRGAFSNFNHCHLLQLQSSPQTSSLVTFNLNPRCQLHPSSSTSTRVAFSCNPHRLSIYKPCHFSISSPPT